MLFEDARLKIVWLIFVLSATMALIAWLIGCEYARRYGAARESLSDSLGGSHPRAVPVQ